MTKHIIKDWTGSIKYNSRHFDSLEDASGFLLEDQRQRNPDASDEEIEQILGEFSIEPVKVKQPVANKGNWNLPFIEKLLTLEGETTVPASLLVENPSLLTLLKCGESKEKCLAFVNSNW